MSDHGELSISELRNKRSQGGGPADPAQGAPAGPHTIDIPRSNPAPGVPGDTEDDSDELRIPFDPWRLVDALRRRWLTIFVVGTILAALAFGLGYWLTPYKVGVVMILRESTSMFQPGLEGESFKPHQLSQQTLVNLLSSGKLAERTAAKLDPPVPAKTIEDNLELQHYQNAPEKVTLLFSGKNPEQLVELANVYVNEAVEMTKEDQLAEGKWLTDSYTKKLKQIDDELGQVNSNLLKFQEQEDLIDPEAETQAYVKAQVEIELDQSRTRMDLELLDKQIEMSRNVESNEKLRAAQEKLDDLLTRLREAHPDVLAQKQVIATIEEQLRTSGGANAQILELENRKKLLESRLISLEREMTDLQKKLSGISQNGLRYATIKSRLGSLHETRKLIEGRIRETALYEENAQGYYRVYAPASVESINILKRILKAAVFGVAGGVAGVLFAAFLVLGAEALDDRLKTVDDVKRITELPVLATLGDLEKMSTEEQEKWAFRTWTILTGKLARSPNQGLVCGFISANPGEGRSTWVNTLVNAASQRGLRVLTVSAGQGQSVAAMSEDAAATGPAQSFSEALTKTMEDSPVPTSSGPDSMTLEPHVLAFPAEVSRRLINPNLPPIAHIPLPGWVWNLERRKQWQSALAHWRTIESVVILVELPPATVPESILLAENVPQLIWLVGSGQSRAKETRLHLETLRHARCRLVGAVLNREPEMPFKL